MADAGRALPEQPRERRRWWSPVALVAVFAAALLTAGPWTPLASIGLGADCASAAPVNPNHVGVVVDSSISGKAVATKCVGWGTNMTAKDAVMAVYKDNVKFDGNGRVCFIDNYPSGGCQSPPSTPGYWAFATSDGKGSWVQQAKDAPQDKPIDNKTVVGWKYIVDGGAPQTPAIMPNLQAICPPEATTSPTPSKTPSKTPTPTATSTTGAPGSGSNPGTTGGYIPPTYTLPTGQPTQPSAGYPGLPGTTGIGDTGSGTPGGAGAGKLPDNRAAAYDTKDWTRWGLILVAAGFALVIVTMGLFGTNVYLSRKAAPKGRHRRGERRSFAV